MSGQHDPVPPPYHAPIFLFGFRQSPPVATLLIVINDISEDNTAKHLSCDGLFRYKFIIQRAGKRIYKIGKHLVTLQPKCRSYRTSHSP